MAIVVSTFQLAVPMHDLGYLLFAPSWDLSLLFLSRKVVMIDVMQSWFDSRSLGQLLLQHLVVLAPKCFPVRSHAPVTIPSYDAGESVD